MFATRIIKTSIAVLALALLVSCGKAEEPMTAAPPPTAAPAPQAPPAPPAAPAAQPPSVPEAPTAAASAPQASAPQPAASTAKSIQTQMGMTGDVEVDVIQANVREGILTVTLAYRNNGKEKNTLRTYPIDEVYFISEIEKKKYHVLKDSKAEWIASPVARNMLGFETGGGVMAVEIPSGGKVVVWFKFPAPGDNVQVVNLVVPDVLPFEKLPIAR